MIAITAIVRLIGALLDRMIHFVYWWIYEGDLKLKKKLSPIKDPLLLEPATVLAEKIRQGQIKSKDVVLAYIGRIAEVNHHLNCFVSTVSVDEALRQAEMADDLVSRHIRDGTPNFEKDLARDKPLLGIPFTNKDSIAATGMSFTAGLVARIGRKAGDDGGPDADAVQMLKSRGAILLGVTNVPEACMWMETSNRIYGRTVNPYHPGRTVGGSSGGEGCAIASGASLCGIGSDIGGSIRMPSFMNGIFGLKPSMGVVSNKGQIPGGNSEYLTTGPMCRYARDLPLLFKCMMRQDEIERLKLDEPLPNVRKLKIFYMTDNQGGLLESDVHPDLRGCMFRLLSSLAKNLGLAGQELKLEEMKSSFIIWHNLVSSEEGPSFCSELSQGKAHPINPIWELMKWCCFKKSDHTLPSLMLALSEKLLKGKAIAASANSKKLRDSLRESLDTVLGEDGVLLYPSHPMPAPYHGQPIWRPANCSYTSIFNVLGNPVVQVPIGLGSWKVPLGLQLVSARHQERNAIALAIEVERLFGGWVPPE